MVARGSLTDKRVYRDRGRIWTEFTLTLSASPLRVSPALQSRDELSSQGSTPILHAKLLLLGGSMGGLTQMIPGAPHPEIGQELIVFVRCSSLARCTPIGFGQGLWSPHSPDLWAPMTQDVEWIGTSAPLRALDLTTLTTPPAVNLHPSPLNSNSTQP